jgi:hypothetical protein
LVVSVHNVVSLPAKGTARTGRLREKGNVVSEPVKIDLFSRCSFFQAGCLLAQCFNPPIHLFLSLLSDRILWRGRLLVFGRLLRVLGSSRFFPIVLWHFDKPSVIAFDNRIFIVVFGLSPASPILRTIDSYLNTFLANRNVISHFLRLIAEGTDAPIFGLV